MNSPHRDLDSRAAAAIDPDLLETARREGWWVIDVRKCRRGLLRRTTAITLGDEHRHGLVVEVDRRGRLWGPQTYVPPTEPIAPVWVGTTAEVTHILTRRRIPSTAVRNPKNLQGRFG